MNMPYIHASTHIWEKKQPTITKRAGKTYKFTMLISFSQLTHFENCWIPRAPLFVLQSTIHFHYAYYKIWFVQLFGRWMMRTNVCIHFLFHALSLSQSRIQFIQFLSHAVYKIILLLSLLRVYEVRACSLGSFIVYHEDICSWLHILVVDDSTVNIYENVVEIL